MQLRIWQHFIQKLYLPRPLIPSQGWTLLELVIISVMVSIFASMAIPSMTGMTGKNSLKSSLNQVKGAVQEAQRNAIKKGQSCTVRIISNRITGDPVGCITEPITLGSEITINGGAAVSNFSFSYKGNTTINRVIFLSSTKTSQKLCLEVSSGIGIMRSGTYDGTNCNSSF